MASKTDNIKSKILLYISNLKPQKNSILANVVTKLGNEKIDTVQDLKNAIISRALQFQLKRLETCADLLVNNNSLTTRLFTKGRELKFESVTELTIEFSEEKLCSLFLPNQIQRDFEITH